ncbi:lysosome membrane protein 2-like [Lytechinus variegatus]|uniref:lysosome membrane protein 2-like n=1 Tax=Lytechinus variegatus TaxID=7654 RepID=UPI001BB13A67|nr:lysosome membrane protein 2-like [Lytechinus variegatus]XP_041455774.1 lysosome membrane protein 2-like [Lytechinus variegatus]
MAQKVCFITTGVIGTLLVIAGISFLHYFPIIFESIVKKQTVLANNSTGFEEWANPPAPIYLEFYVWNLENPDGVVKGDKPNVTQRGPYVYREERPKVNVTEHGNGTVSYTSPQSFFIDLDLSVGDPMNDTFTTLNVPLLTVVNELQFMSAVERIALYFLIGKHQNVCVTHTVHEYIWGYKDEVLTKIKEFKPDLVPTDVFGFFAGKNNSNDGVYTVYTGETDSKLTNTIDNWKGMESLPYWTTPQANMINGTDGTYNHPFITKNDTVYVFSSDICRSIYALFLEETNTRGVPTYRFAPPSYLFANYTIYPPNIGFCTPDVAHCYPGGLLNVSLCQFGAPIFMSSPHFLYADQSVMDMVIGVHPVEELHRTFFDLEPYTGGPLNVSKKLQINAHLKSYDFYLEDWYKHVSEAYVPLVWINEHGAVTQESADDLKKQLYLPLKIGTYGTWAVLGFGCLLAVLSLTCISVMVCKAKRSSRPLDYSVNSDENAPLINGSTRSENVPS